MSKLIPRTVSADMWKQLTPNRAYAIRARSEDDIHLRFGPGGFYISVLSASPSGRVVNSVSLEEGDLTVLGRIRDKESAVVGRATECAIKVSHAVMSRHHVEVRLDENVLIVKDLGSTNGTFYHAENIVFDIEEYIKNHPLDKAAESTMDEIHEAFGIAIDDFLKRYQENKNTNS